MKESGRGDQLPLQALVFLHDLMQHRHWALGSSASNEAFYHSLSNELLHLSHGWVTVPLVLLFRGFQLLRASSFPLPLQSIDSIQLLIM